MRLSIQMFAAAALIMAIEVHAQDPTRFVNPFIGTAGGGNTFPGAVLPWGMVSVSPHTDLGSPSGYTYGQKTFFGLGHNHLSGTGCAELGSIVVTVKRDSIGITPGEYKSSLSAERAEPGYYRGTLQEASMQCEAAVTTRAGMTRWTSLRPGKINFIIDVGRSLGLLGGGGVAIVSDHEVEGYNISGGFCGEANRETVYFAARFNKKSHARGVWLGRRISESKNAQAQDTSIGAWLTFDVGESEEIIVKVALSYVSIQNARLNLDAEIPQWDFDWVRNKAKSAWRQQLSRIIVEDTSTANKTKFYTALYHMLIHPSAITDVNGEYPLMRRTGIGRYAGRERYSIFSLWDTYRTLHPFLTLVFPEQQSQMVQTLVDMYRESGWLPKWELLSNETYMMVGDPASIVLADTYVKGIRDFDAVAAFNAMKKPAVTLTKEALPARPGYKDYLRLGYIPSDQDKTQEWWVWGPVSTMLEYNLADWSIAQMARALGKNEEAVEFERRALLYKNLFDSTTLFLRPRMASGEWHTPFDPLQTEGSGDWVGSGGPGYVEGNAWNYTWFVPHDIDGLVKLFGGHESFQNKLERCFRDGHFTVTNEPDIAYPYLFTYLPGKEGRTQELVAEILSKEFGADADGLPGNDDCGTISAWFVFSALGFYPACPAKPEYRLGIPLFSKTTIRLSEKYYSGNELVIERRKGFPEATTVLNNKILNGFRLTHEDLLKGGHLLFQTK
ncbi:MAG: glycoside hydrolase family 92 protein [Ignavibacteriales bacterium]|nr:glycoside hydrolase family 92 protein [Ignavibacteriales bacterium]